MSNAKGGPDRHQIWVQMVRGTHWHQNIVHRCLEGGLTAHLGTMSSRSTGVGGGPRGIKIWSKGKWGTHQSIKI